MTRRPVPIACNLELAEWGLRMKEWWALIERALVEKSHTEAGIRLTFGDAAEEELRRLAAAEGECCGFAKWVVTYDRELVLEVQAEGLGVEAVRSMFD